MLLPAPTPTPTPTVALAMGTSPYTPPAITAFAPARLLAQRQATDYSYGYSYSYSYGACDDLFASLTCDGAYVSCIESADSSVYSDGVTSYDVGALQKALTSCYCAYGSDYLNCYYSAMSTQTCYSDLYLSNWESYESDWFSSSCGTVPKTFQGAGKTTATPAKNKKQQPTSVSLDFQSVAIVTPNSTLSVPAYTYTPLYRGSGSLLAAECASTRFTLIEDVSTVIWLPYVGCAIDQPQCCPWTASSAFFAATVTADTTATLTTSPPQTRSAGVTNNAFPVPAATAANVLLSCAADYSSVSGNRCCPSGYWPFTRDLGGQTPCWSSMTQTTRAPTLTAGLPGEPTQTQKPTSAVVNIVWAMSYPVAPAKKGLSAGGIAGAVVGSVVAIAVIATLGFFLWRARRKNGQLKGPQPPMQQQLQPQLEQQQLRYLPVGPTQLQGMPGELPPGSYAYAPASSGVSTLSALVPQSTGTTVSELGGGTSSIASGSALLPGGQPLPYVASPVYPAPIAEADETAIQQQQQQQMQGYAMENPSGQPYYPQVPQQTSVGSHPVQTGEPPRHV